MFSRHFTKGDTVCFLGGQNDSEKWSTLEGKNLLLKEQILSFKSRPPVDKKAKMKVSVSQPPTPLTKKQMYLSP